GQLGAGFDPMFIPQNADAPDFQPLPPLLGIDRIADRRRLLQAVDGQARAIDLVTSHAARRAFDLGLEPDSVRARYGSTPFGQGCLLARRLVEAGVTFVEVESNGWDTHLDNFERVKSLAGTVDPAFAALVADLKERGMLERTLVVWTGEFGRT